MLYDSDDFHILSLHAWSWHQCLKIARHVYAKISLLQLHDGVPYLSEFGSVSVYTENDVL